MPDPIYEQGQGPQGYLNAILQQRQQRSDEFKGALDRYRTMANTPPADEDNEAAMWGAMAQGFSKPADSFWMSLANAGAAKAAQVQRINEDFRARQLAEAKDEMTAQKDILRVRDLLGGSTSRSGRSMIKQGEVWLERDPITGAWRPVAAGEGALASKDYQFGIDQAAKVLDTDDPAVLRAYALSYVEQQRALRGQNPVTAAQTPGSNMLTPVQTAPGMQIPSTGQAQTNAAVSILQAELAKQRALRDAAQVGSPERNAANQNIVNLSTELRAKLGGTKLKTAESEGEKKGRGETRGKNYENLFMDVQRTGQAALDVSGKLNAMEQLLIKYGDKVPEGELAPYLTSLKSGLSTFGINVEGAGASDVIKALGTEQALKSRTADGTNLMPGAMSDYEDRLLQAMTPGLAMTQEGRLLMIQIAKAQLRMRAELSKAAREYYSKHGELDAGWEKIAAQIGGKNPLLDPKRIAAIQVYANRLSSKGGQ